jgi:hypothetical protein
MHDDNQFLNDRLLGNKFVDKQLLDNQLLLFDDAPYLKPVPFARAGSQKWIQIAVNHYPDVLRETLRPALHLEDGEDILWLSPRACENFREYRDKVALRRLGIHLPERRLESFWSNGGPVWDCLGKTTLGRYLFIESKAHIGEIFSPPTRATYPARTLIEQSLNEARQHYAPWSKANWCGLGFQCANRLAFQYLIGELNRVPSHTVFLYFTNCREMNGPTSPRGWHRAIASLHRILGLPPTLDFPNVHEVFLDIRQLGDKTSLESDGMPLPEKTIIHEHRARCRDFPHRKYSRSTVENDRTPLPLTCINSSFDVLSEESLGTS